MTTTTPAIELVHRLQNLSLNLGNVPAYFGRSVVYALLTNPGVPAEVRSAVIETCGTGSHRWMTKTLLLSPELTREDFDAISALCIENLEVIPNETAADILPEVLSNPAATEPMLREAFSLAKNQREILLDGLIPHPHLPGDVYRVFFDATATGLWPENDEALREFCFSNIAVDDLIADFNRPGSLLPSLIADQVVASSHFGLYPLADQVALIDYQVVEAPKKLGLATTGPTDLISALAKNHGAHPDALLHVWRQIRSEVQGWNRPVMRIAVDDLVRNHHFPQSAIRIEDLDLSHDLSGLSLYDQEEVLVDYNFMSTDHGVTSVDVRTFIALDPTRTEVPEALRLDFVQGADRLLLAMIVRNAPEVSVELADAIVSRLLERVLWSEDDAEVLLNAILNLPVSAEALASIVPSLTHPEGTEESLVSALLLHPSLPEASRERLLKGLNAEERDAQAGVIGAAEALSRKASAFLQRKNAVQAYVFGRALATAAGEDELVKFVNSWMDLLQQVWASQVVSAQENFGILEILEPALLSSVFVDYLRLRGDARSPEARWLRITVLAGMS